MRECKARFGFSNHAWDKAVIGGLIVPRDPTQKRWKHETRSAVERLLDRGMTQSEIAFELGLSKPTVSYHARRLGLPRDERASRRFDWALIQQAHDAGLSARECCARFGCSARHGRRLSALVVCAPGVISFRLTNCSSLASAAIVAISAAGC
ncbi:MAG: ArsR family transcriptional regulator [Solirubrobacteraceae bacterium]